MLVAVGTGKLVSSVAGVADALDGESPGATGVLAMAGLFDAVDVGVVFVSAGVLGAAAHAVTTNSAMPSIIILIIMPPVSPKTQSRGHRKTPRLHKMFQTI